MVEGTRSLLKDAILSDPPWALQDPMKQGGSPKLRSGNSVPAPCLLEQKNLLHPHQVEKHVGAQTRKLAGLAKPSASCLVWGELLRFGSQFLPSGNDQMLKYKDNKDHA